MMLAYVFTVVLVAILVCYMKKEVVSEKSFTLDSHLERRLIFDLLKSPVNLELIHPRIEKVFDIRIDNSSTSFQIEEDLGILIGKRTFPMVLTAFMDISHATSGIRLGFRSFILDGAVTLTINDNEPSLFSTTQPKPVVSHIDLHASTIHGHITVKSMRILNYFISSFLLNVWKQTITNALETLNKESVCFSS